MDERILTAAEATEIINATGRLEHVTVDVSHGGIEITRPGAVIAHVTLITAPNPARGRLRRWAQRITGRTPRKELRSPAVVVLPMGYPK